MRISPDRAPLPRVLAAAATLGVALLLVGVGTAGPGAERAAAAGTSCAYAGDPLRQLSIGALRYSVACLINEERASSGLARLTSRRRLYRAARHHNADMQINIHHMTHTSSNGDSMSTRIRRYGYMSGASRWSVGEIIGEGWGSNETPLQIMNAWLRSPGHDKVIHTARYRDFGVAARYGTAENPNASGAIFTVDFGRRNPAL
jgi:uncharacterized protein YkwD